MALHDELRRRRAEPENGHMRTTNRDDPAVLPFHRDPALANGALVD